MSGTPDRVEAPSPQRHIHLHDHGEAPEGLDLAHVGRLDAVAQAFYGINLDGVGYMVEDGCCGCC